ncbi:MAG: hypothetical protein Q8P67_25920 [archaeon]|nr:hypothetical protein [archaeon]
MEWLRSKFSGASSSSSRNDSNSSESNTSQDVLAILEHIQAWFSLLEKLHKNEADAPSIPDAHQTTEQLLIDLQGATVLVERSLREANTADPARFEALLEAFGRLRSQTHPSNWDAAYQEAVKNYHEAPPEDKEGRASLLRQSMDRLKIIEASEDAKSHLAVYSALMKAFSNVRSGSFGKSNRSKRAKEAGAVFSRHAGLNVIPGLEVDENGNAKKGGDLGLDGCFEGMEVVVLHFYTLEGFDFSLPDAALRQKGFTIRRFTKAPELDELEQALTTASQCWVISTSRLVMNQEHAALIVKYWRQGMGVYAFGDNDPYFADANMVLSQMFGPELNMSRNLPGDKMATTTADNAGLGFVPHLLTTGISKLHTGVTVSTFSNQAALQKHNFEPILFECTDNPIVVYRPAQDGCGPTIADGAFTKLFYKWDHCGSDRFVRNCACLLSTILGNGGPAAPVADAEKKKEEEEEGVLQPDFTGALIAECDITFEEGPVALLVRTLVDGAQNTSDFIIDNAFGAAADNLVFGQQLYSYENAKLFLRQGQDPFRKVTVVMAIPLLDLGVPINRTLMEELICQVFMGGRKMPKVAWFIFLSVCEHMLTSTQPDHPEAWRYMIDQILRHVTSTPTFTNEGPQVPLLDAMAAYMAPAFSSHTEAPTGPPDLTPYRKSVTHTAVVLRVLVSKNLASPEAARAVLRKLIAKFLLNGILAFTHHSGNPSVRKVVEQHCMDTYHDIALQHSGRLCSFSEALYLFKIGDELAKVILDEVSTTSRALGLDCGFSDNDTTLVLAFARAVSNWAVSSEALLNKCLHCKWVSGLWQPSAPATASSTASSASTAENGVEILNKDYAVYFEHDDVHRQYVPFVTCQGPSTWRCVCGLWFGNPNDPLDSDQIKRNRNSHFVAVFASDPNGYPTATSAHISLHRVVIDTLTSPEFAGVQNRAEKGDAIERAVSAELIRRNKGNYHISDISRHVERSIDEYLQLRRSGAPELLTKPLRIDYLDKLLLEKPIATELYNQTHPSD